MSDKETETPSEEATHLTPEEAMAKQTNLDAALTAAKAAPDAKPSDADAGTVEEAKAYAEARGVEEEEEAPADNPIFGHGDAAVERKP